MNTDNKLLSVVLFNGTSIDGIEFSGTDTIQDLKSKISPFNTTNVDFKIVYCGRSLTNEDELFSTYYRSGQNKLYLLTIGVKGGCCGKTGY